MWLLSTDRAVLHFFAAPEAAIGGFAILSHTWGDSEQSFQDIKKIEKRCKKDGTNPRNSVSDKIRQCCILAERHGYKWVWIDSCCIDKTSGTELSEAINSMFRWYQQAEVCYAFLADVPRDCGPLDAPNSPFRASRWHRRGWTLQELIAPETVMFLSADWIHIGSKEDPEVASLLNEITGIPCEVLARTAAFFDYSIAGRMSWAANRSTTRVEDEAYCLMGLFGVNMPTIYGEGRDAFQRLQHEIMRKSSDTSLFAWGRWISDESLHSQGLEVYSGSPLSSLHDIHHLFAPSSHYFLRDVYFTPTGSNLVQTYPPIQGSAGPFDRIELPRLITTSYGIKCRFPMIEADSYTIAVLLCQTASRDHLGLLLEKDTSGKDPTRPRYYTSARFHSSGGANTSSIVSWRMVSLGSDLYNLRFNGKVVRPAWRTFYIVPSPVDSASPNMSFSRVRLGSIDNAAFRIPHWLIATFTAAGFQMKQLTDNSREDVRRMLLGNRQRGEWIYIDLGLCRQQIISESAVKSESTPGTSELHPPSAPWARVLLLTRNSTHVPTAATHNCSKDHVDVWPGRTKKFGNAKRKVRISFTPCGMAPHSTLVVHIELLGTVYEEILSAANVSIPTREVLPVAVSVAVAAPSVEVPPSTV